MLFWKLVSLTVFQSSFLFFTTFEIILGGHICLARSCDFKQTKTCNWWHIPYKVAEHSFGSLWVYIIFQIMARERLQPTSWNLASEQYTDERFEWQVKFDVFVVSMSTWTIENNLKISLLPSLQNICSLDFPINLHTAYYN